MKISETFEQLRTSKSARIWCMVALIVIVIVLYITGVIKKGFAIGLGIIILAAIGIETLGYDLDLGTLWNTGNIEQSRVSHTKDGIKLMGSCALPKNQTDPNDLDCKNFKTQATAQFKYNQCASEIASYNAGIDIAKVRSLDIYGLDRDKDGVVCEALTSIPKEESKEEPVIKKSSSTPTKKSSTSTTRTKSTASPTETSGTFQTTPVLRTGDPYKMTEASDRSTPKALPAK